MSAMPRRQWLPRLLVATILFALLPALRAQANQQVAVRPESDPYPGELAGAIEENGLIARLPEHGLLGYWSIGANLYQVTEATILDDTEGAFAAGSCALVRYQTGGPATAGGTVPPIGGTVPPMARKALRITSENAVSCTEAAPGRGNWIGRVDARPASGLVGDWTVRNADFLTTGSSHLEGAAGSFIPGACVKLRYDSAGHGATAERPWVDLMHPMPEASCLALERPANRYRFGVVDSRPDGDAAGLWVVDGITYSVTVDSRVRQHFGAATAGACVKVRFDESVNPAWVWELESRRANRCQNPAGEEGAGVLFATVMYFPDGFTGNWDIGDLTFAADQATIFDQAKAVLAPGSLAKVSFRILEDGTFYAKRVVAVQAPGSDDDNDGAPDGAEGIAWGRLQRRPVAGGLGIWTVGGIDFTATADTRLRSRYGAPPEGAWVKVEFRVEDGARIARLVAAAPGSEGVFTLAGHVQSMPANSFQGAYTIGGAHFVSSAGSLFREANGLIAVGSYVKADYRFNDGIRELTLLQSEVPPGGGDERFSGALQSMGSQMDAAGLAMEVWQVGVRTFLVNAAADLNDDQHALATGDFVAVNGYRNDEGQVVATQIQVITLSHTLFLPINVR
jgi:hypothetical protein